MSPEEATAFANAQAAVVHPQPAENKWVPALQRYREPVDAVANPAIEPLHRRPSPPCGAGAFELGGAGDVLHTARCFGCEWRGPSI
jgi:hypothetical protein